MRRAVLALQVQQPQSALLLALTAVIPALMAPGAAIAEEKETPNHQPPPPGTPLWRSIAFLPLRTTDSTTVRGLTADMDLDLNQVLRPLTMAADVRGQEGRTSRDGIRRLDASLNNIQGIDDLAARYRFSEREEVIAKAGSFSAIPYAGVRFIDMRYDLVVQFEGPRLSASRSRSFGGTVAQPLIGTQAMVFLTPPLRLFARGDIGGFGVNNSDDYSANAQVGLGDAVGNNTQLNLSWRYMHLGGTNDQSPENAYSINQNGVELGAKFLF